MAIALRSTTSQGSTADATTIVINVPAGVVNGDVLVLALETQDGVSPATISGWTTDEQVSAGSGGTGMTLSVYHRVASSEPASYTITVSAVSPRSAVMAAYSGVNTTTPVNVHASGSGGNNTDQTVVCPTVTTTADGCEIVLVVGSKGTVSSVTYTAPSGYVNEVGAVASNGGASPWRNIELADKSQTSHGATSAQTFATNYSGANHLVWDIGITLALAPAATAYTQALTAGLSFVGATPVRAITRAHAAGLSFAGSVTKGATRVLPAAILSFTGAHTKRTGKTLTGGLSFSGAITKRAIGKALTAGLSFTGTTVRGTSRLLIAGLSFSGSLTKQTARTLVAAALAFSGNLVTSRQFVRTLTAGLSFAGSITRQTGKSLTAGLTFSGSVTKQVAKTLTAALSFVGALATQKTGGLAVKGAVVVTAAFGAAVSILDAIVSKVTGADSAASSVSSTTSATGGASVADSATGTTQVGDS